jgi:PAS domain S-box-containing protein
LLLLLFIGVNATLEVALQNNLTVPDKIRDAQQSRVSVHHLIAALHEAESGQRGYLLTRDPVYLKAFDTGRGDAGNEIAKTLPVGEQWPEVEALRNVTRKKLAELDEAVVLQQSERGKEARSILETGRGRNLMERVEELQKLIDQRLDEQTNERNVAYWRSSDLVRKTVITSYVLALALLLCAAMMFWEEIRRRVAMERDLRAGEAGLEARIAERTRELRESEAKFRELTNAIPQVVWRSDANGVADFYNERWYELTGAPRDVRGDDGWAPYVHPEDLAASAPTYRKTLREGRPFDNEMRLWDQKRQAFRWYLVRSLPLRDERGKVCNWLGTSTDIHDRKEAARRLEELHDAVETSRP